MQALPDCLDTLYSERAKLQEALLTENTRRGQLYDWRAFCRWVDRMGVPALPADVETVSLYTTAALASGRKVSSVARALSTISSMHRRNDLASPVSGDVRLLLRAARRSRTETLRQVRPLSLVDLRRASRALRLDGRAIALRDRAILVIGFASALRSANVVALSMADLAFCDRGIVLTVHREKSHQEAEERLIGLPRGRFVDTDPVRVLRAWLAVRGEEPGPVFTHVTGGNRLAPLNPERLCQIVQAAVARIHRDPRLYGSHSLRAGFCTEAGEVGVGELLIAAHTGHKDISMLRRYFRHRDVWRANVCTAIGL